MTRQPPAWHHPVNAPTPVNGPITIVPFDLAWPGQFARERKRIVDALGDRAILIEHIGSTSVPALAAKPIIDILLVVEDCADDIAYTPDLEAAGYVLRIREPADQPNSTFDGVEPHRVFKGPGIDLNLHVWLRHSPEIERNLVFRDWLRSDRADRLLYERTKLDLGGRSWNNVQQYANAKTQIIGEILSRAMATR